MRTGALERLLLLLTLFCYVFFSFFWFPCYVDGKRSFGQGDPFAVIVAPGLSGFEVARSLESQGLVRDGHALARCFVRMNIDRKLKPGAYLLRPGAPWEVAQQMLESRPSTVLRTLVPGVYLSDTEDYRKVLGEDVNFPEGLRPFLPKDPLSRTVFLLPDSYRVDPGDTEAAQFVQKASQAWWELFGGRFGQDISPEDMERQAILASIVEKEARRDVERPRVAGVFLNRLEKDMPLQSCATVVFAWKLEGKDLQSLSLKDLEIQSPYNTYQNKGLPLAPICVPSRASWEAVFFPEKSEYLYFVAKGDGSHVFSRTYSEHLHAKKKVGQ